MTDPIVILGKRTVRQAEIPHLELFGRAMVERGKQLVTTRTEGVPAVIAKAYTEAGGTVVYLTGTDYRAFTQDKPERVIAFTDTKYQLHLDEKDPEWKSRGWIVIHNPKATEEAATYLTQLLTDWASA